MAGWEPMPLEQMEALSLPGRHAWVLDGQGRGWTRPLSRGESLEGACAAAEWSGDVELVEAREYEGGARVR